MELKNSKQIRFTDTMMHDIDVYRASKLPPLTFSEAARALIQSALEQKETKHEGL